MYQYIEIWPSIVLHEICKPDFIKEYRNPSDSAIMFRMGLNLISTMLFESCPIWCIKISKTEINRNQNVKDFNTFFKKNTSFSNR